MPARATRHRHRDRLFSGADGVRLQVWFALALNKDSDLHPVIHGHLSFDTCFVDHHLARLHVERHLPGAALVWCRRLVSWAPKKVFFSKRSCSRYWNESG